ncbi:MAG TPA: flavin reductase [Micromonosporaceae bacterium]|nr:flavin reductase [Micromonosporaceae bacterium]
MRRLRGRFAQTVTLWTAPGPAGLTVSSCLVADGEPGKLLGLIDDESTLWTSLKSAGVFAVTPLTYGQQQLADRFAGLLPAPGGLFRQGEPWAETAFGPVLGETWAGCRLDSAREFGWGLLIEATIAEITLGPTASPLLHHRGSYAQLHDR